MSAVGSEKPNEPRRASLAQLSELGSKPNSNALPYVSGSSDRAQPNSRCPSVTSTGTISSPLMRRPHPRSGASSSSPANSSLSHQQRSHMIDLGYDSLHSTPKSTIINPDNSTAAEITELVSDLPDEGDDDDNDDPLLQSISCGRPRLMSTATVRHSTFRRLLFKWNPFERGSNSNGSTATSSSVVPITRKQVARQQNLSDDDDEDYSDSLTIDQATMAAAHSVTNGPTTTDLASQEKKEPEREEWGKKIDFLLSIIGFAVDLSNVWRFPYLCYKNGGGVFLIPYTIMLLFGALPLFFLELALGQFAKSGPISLWDKICPPLKGIGYCFVLISWYVSFYYNVIIAWTTNYVIKTIISGELMPWQHCSNWYNTPDCITMEEIKQLRCRSTNSSSASCAKLSNRTSPTEEFFNRGLLQIDQVEGLSGLGNLRPELVGCLIIVFFVLYFSLFKGVKSSGKVVWVTATAPYFILTILLARGLFLPGAMTGITYYLNPQLDKLLDPMVWVDAAVQVFYSIGVGFGVHLTYASFNKFHNNCYRDCLITAAVNSLTSFYSGFVIFTYLGYMAYSMDKEVQNVASEGYGLVFQVYPEAIATLPFAKFWSLLFFIMLLTLGIDSAMGGLEAVITGLMDEFNLKWIKREYFTIFIISTSFAGALINCTQGGAFTMVWFDTYSAGISLLCSAMFEALAVTYFYGIERFCLDVESMIGHRPSWYFVISWKYISPIFLTTIIIMSIINSESITYYGHNFPTWATVCGWLFTLSSISAIPIYALFWWVKNRLLPRLRPPKQSAAVVVGKGQQLCLSTSSTNQNHLVNSETSYNQDTRKTEVVKSSQHDHHDLHAVAYV